MTANYRAISPYSARVKLLLALLTAGTAITAEAQRSAADLARDKTSKTDAVAAFAGVKANWKILDLFAGDGYYSEALARRVGANGVVYLHNTTATKPAPGLLRRRLGRVSRTTGRAQHWPNIIVLERELSDLAIASDSLDMVMLAKIYHDAYYRNNGWQLDPDDLFNFILRVLKPGGTLTVIDHSALSGTGAAAAQTLHRIERDFAVKDISQRGFRWSGASDLLRNSQDTRERSVFDPSIRGKSDRFLLTFRKPHPQKKGP